MKNVFLGIALLATSAMANASIIVVLDSVTSVSGGNSGFNYQADLTNDEELNPAASSGVTCPGPNHTIGAMQPAGNVLYDL